MCMLADDCWLYLAIVVIVRFLLVKKKKVLMNKFSFTTELRIEELVQQNNLFYLMLFLNAADE